MTVRRLRIVFLGLTITSYRGNGHAATYRALTKGLAARGHDVLFLERNVPEFARHRDLPMLPWGRAMVYRDLDQLRHRHTRDIREADLVVVGSNIRDGVEIGEWVMRTAKGTRAFYDLDTPATLARLRAGNEDYVSRSLVHRYDLYLSFTGGPSLERLQIQFGAERVHALHGSVDPEFHRPVPASPAWDLGYLGTYSPDRGSGLELLMIEPARRWPRGRFVVAGAEYPNTITWPANVERLDDVPPADQLSFYGAQRYVLNLTRSDRVEAGHSPSVRLFQAAACGTPVISDWWTGLDEFFEPGKEILVAGGPIDVLALVRDIPESQRLLVAQSARERVLADHTGVARARQLEEYVLEPALRDAG